MPPAGTSVDRGRRLPPTARRNQPAIDSQAAEVTADLFPRDPHRGQNLTTPLQSRGLQFGINFHGVGTPGRALEEGEASVWLSPDQMNEILDLATDRPDVFITSDDGNMSDLEVLMPALLARSLTGTFFVLTGRLGERGSLGERHVQELVEAGMRVGLHGERHVSWRRLGARDRRAEWIDAKDRLEQISGQRVTEAACPFGAYDRSVVSGLRSLGFERMYTSDPGWGATGRFINPRNSVGVGSRNLDATGVGRLLAHPAIDARARIKRWIKRWR